MGGSRWRGARPRKVAGHPNPVAEVRPCACRALHGPAAGRAEAAMPASDGKYGVA